MSYVTPEDMITLFTEREMIEATNWSDPTAIEIVSDRLQAACTGATGIVNGYLMRRFTIPLENPTPELLETLRIHTANLAREILNQREEVVAQADKTRDWLQMFSEGSGDSGDTTPGVDPIERSGLVSYELPDRAWTADTLKNLGF